MGSASFFCNNCIVHWMGILVPTRLYLPYSIIIGGLVFCVISLCLYFIYNIMFASNRRILPLLLLIFCSWLITQLSASLYGPWNSLLTCLFVGPSIVSLLAWVNWPNGLSLSQLFWVRGSSLCHMMHTFFLTTWFIALVHLLWYFMTKILGLHLNSGPPCGRSLGLRWYCFKLSIHSRIAKLNMHYTIKQVLRCFLA